MRFVLALCLLCGTALAQQLPSLAQYLGLTASQIASIQQLNDARNQFAGPKNNRIAVLQRELAVENAKASPDPIALGQRYLEIDSIDREIGAQEADTRTRIAAQLTSRQIALLQQISTAAVQGSLLNDAGCGFLVESSSPLAPFFGFAVVNTVPAASGSFGFFSPNLSSCLATYPISVRNYLALTDLEVAGILALEFGYVNFQAQKSNRTADVQVELRDELAKPVLDPVALGVRYVELAEIAQELTAADKTARASARALLTPSQQAKLQDLVDTSALTNYLFLAETCHLLTIPAGSSTAIYYINGLCRLN